MFKDRLDAGYALANRLLKYKNTDTIVLAIPKGGIPIGYIVANELRLPLEPIFSKKIGYPGYKEYAIGAVSAWGSFVTPHSGVSESYIREETDRIKEYLKQLQNAYLDGRAPAQLNGKTLIVIDDGIATGNTLLATINTLKQQQPAKIIVAVPVSTQLGFDLLSKHCDELISIITESQYFHGVGAYYQNFRDVSEEQVLYYLDKNRKKCDRIFKSDKPGISSVCENSQGKR
ncbi:MAG: phosphoribosyltransferase [Bacteroidetes bacterium]|jgi:predicted phosphoribosyltransferase|nr:phosphoribosyltransferase [Bacteroidota bacterium]